MSALQGRTAFVTGSIQGIGLEIAKALAGHGARIALHGLGDEAAKTQAVAAAQEAGAPEARFFDGDLADPAQIEALVTAVQDWGAIDILVNNAGIQKTVTLADADRVTWDAILAVNLSACFDTMRLCLPGMGARGFGRVINIASVHGIVASVAKAPYVAAKHGLVGMSKVAALEYARAGSAETGGVTVNCICPGWTDTAIIQPQIAARAEEHGSRAAGIASLLREKQPSQRLSDASEIGAIAAFLCQPVAHNITGVSLPVDGGWTAQ